MCGLMPQIFSHLGGKDVAGDGSCLPVLIFRVGDASLSSLSAIQAHLQAGTVRYKCDDVRITAQKMRSAC